MLKNCRFSKLRRQQRRPGIPADFAVRLQSRFGLEAPDGFFGCGAEFTVRGLTAEEFAAAAGIARSLKPAHAFLPAQYGQPMEYLIRSAIAVSHS